MKLQINEFYFISDIEPGDKAAFLEHFKEKQIYDQTLAIPYPYTEADADWWINHNLEATKSQDGRAVNWAIRRNDGQLIGGIGFLGLKIGEDFKSELGYWLAKPYWGKGLMTEAVTKVVDYAFKELGLVRITAHVFDSNTGSARVLEKSGFKCEGLMRSNFKKDGKIFDGKLYARLASEIQNNRSEDSNTNEIKKLRNAKNENDRRKALQHLTTYLGLHGNDAEAWYDKAGCHDFLGEEKEAEPCYQRVYELGWQKLPINEQRSFFVGFGSTLRNNLKFEKSREVLEEGIRNFPGHPALKVFFAFTLYSQRQDRDAARTLFKVISDSSAKGLGGYERAVKWYADHLDSHPEKRS